MKSIFDYLQENLINKNDELITESFKASIFHRIQDQFAAYNKKEDEEDAEYKARGWNWHSPSYIKFKTLFGRYNIAWDKIDDSMVKEYSKDSKEGISLAKRIVGNRSNHVNGIIILAQDYNGKEGYDGIIISVGNGPEYISFRSSWGSKHMRPSDVIGLITEKIYIIEITDEINTWRKKNERWSQQKGSFTPGNEEYYKIVAKDNVDRYTKLLAKYKAERDANDGITEKVGEYTDKVLKFAEKISKEPIRYAAYEYDIASLMDLLRDEKHYVRGYGKNPGYYSGTNGLLYLYTDYLKGKLSMAKGYSYDHERREYNACKKAINDMCTKIDSKITEIETKIAKKEAGE